MAPTLTVSTMAEGLRALADVFFPRFCIFCGTAVHHSSPIDACRSCLEQVRLPAGVYCRKCGAPRAEYSKRCPNCHNMRLAFESAAAFGMHRGALRETVLAFKFGAQSHLARTLGALVARAAGRAWPGMRPEAVVGVPLHWKRRRERGFDQARMLAFYTAKEIGAASRSRLLSRTRPTESQIGLTRHARLKNVRGAFAATACDGVKTVLLVDDTMTTGATLSEAARALKGAGVGRVFAAVVARAGFDADLVDAPTSSEGNPE